MELHLITKKNRILAALEHDYRQESHNIHTIGFLCSIKTTLAFLIVQCLVAFQYHAIKYSYIYH